MPDITMCTNKDCELSDTCYRVQAEPSKMQSYSSYENICTEGDRTRYWEVKSNNTKDINNGKSRSTNTKGHTSKL